MSNFFEFLAAPVGATIGQASNTLSTQDGCIGELVSPKFDIPAGISEFTLVGEFIIPVGCFSNLQNTIQRLVFLHHGCSCCLLI